MINTLESWEEKGKPMNHIICCNCIDGLRKMADRSVNIVVTSPPYNLGSSFRGGEVVEMYENYSDNLEEKQYHDLISDCIKECIRVADYTFFNFQLLTNNKKAYLKIIGEFSDNIKDVIIWHKNQWEPSIAKTCLSSAFEFIIVFARKDLCEKRSFERAFFNNRVSGEQTCNVIQGDSASVKEFNSEQGTNKAVFPQYFVRWFLKKFSQEGDIICDPFMGSGTTAVVAKQLNRKYIGFELNKDYCEVAYRRLNQNTLS